jgi:predicted aspartyl protease
LGDKDRIEIPFTEANGLLMLQLRMNGLPLTFMFDTGAENTILFKKEIAQLLGMQSSRRIRIIGSDLSNTIFGFIVHNVHFKIKNNIERIESIIVLEENVYRIQESTGYQVDGLIGGNFFRNTIVKIDYRRNKMVVSHPIRTSVENQEYAEISALFKDQKPYVKAIVNTLGNDNREILLLMDTGSSIPFILHTNVDSTLRVPETMIRGNLGVGLSGTLVGLIGITRNLRFGPYEFVELLTNFQELDEAVLQEKEIIRHGILGNDILRRFTVIVDYFHRKVYMKPSRHYNEAFDYDKSGLVLIASGLDFNEYYVQGVIQHSPADRAGLQKGDKLKSVQCVPVAFRSLVNIQNFFKKKPGKDIRLTVNRGEEIIKFRFELQDMLKSGTGENQSGLETGPVLID